MNKVLFSRKMAAFALLTALIICFAALICACGKQKQVELSQVYDKLIASGKLPTLTKLRERNLYEDYGIDKDKLKQWEWAMSENYAVEVGEVALFEVNDEAYADTLVEKLQNHLNSYKRMSENYNPEQASRLEPVQVKRVGNYVYMVAGEDYYALMQILKDNIG